MLSRRSDFSIFSSKFLRGNCYKNLATKKVLAQKEEQQRSKRTYTVSHVICSSVSWTARENDTVHA